MLGNKQSCSMTIQELVPVMSKPVRLHSERVLFSQIDFEDLHYLFSPPRVLTDLDGLTQSIERVGLLRPPILIKKQNGYYQIVSGHRRLRAAHDATAESSLLCLILPPDTPVVSALAVALEDACACRPLTIMEQALFLQKALLHLDDNAVCEKFLPVLGLTPNRYHIKNSLPLLQLEEPLAYALHQGFLNESVARELITLSFTDRLALFEVIELLQLSVNNQKKLTVACKELARRDNSSIIAILSGEDIQNILNHPDANPPQKASHLMTTLTAKRYPRLSEAEKDFQQFADSLNLPQNATVNHAPSFEKDTVTLSISFTNRQELLDKWPSIEARLK